MKECTVDQRSEKRKLKPYELDHIDRLDEREAQFQRQLLAEQADFHMRQEEGRQRLAEQKLAWERERAHQNAELKKYKERRSMTQMEYDDRANRRQHEQDTELGIIRLGNIDRDHERNYNLARAKLDRVTELANVYDSLQNGMQQRYFNGIAFHDARVGNHRNYVKVDKEQRGLKRDAYVRDIFDEFDMGDPDLLDLTERRISPPVRLLRHCERSSYLHTYLFTGVENVVQKQGKDPYVLFMDGSTKNIPSWAKGYAIQPRMIKPHVWIMDVYKLTRDMLDCDSDDDDWHCCCRSCRKLCNVQ